MGTFGEDCAAKYKFTREAQDAFATASVQRAKKATQSRAPSRRDHAGHGEPPTSTMIRAMPTRLR